MELFDLLFQYLNQSTLVQVAIIGAIIFGVVEFAKPFVVKLASRFGLDADYQTALIQIVVVLLAALFVWQGELSGRMFDTKLLSDLTPFMSAVLSVAVLSISATGSHALYNKWLKIDKPEQPAG